MAHYVLLTVGKTHTGKTTFVKNIAPHIANSVVVETDPIALFLRENYETFRTFDSDHTGSFKSPSLKFLVLKTILDFALGHNLNILMSNSNMYENGRREVLNIIKKYPVKTIGIYFNYPEELLLKRVAESQRDTKVLSVSKDFNELIINQRTRFQPPNPNEFDHFFEATNLEELLVIEKEIFKLFESEV